MSGARHLSSRDFRIGTAVGLVMGTLFALFANGRCLLLTFVPGVAFAWLAFVRFRSHAALPRGLGMAPLYFATLAVQLLHFAKEYATGFPERFPALYGGDPFGKGLFISFNLIAYAVFALGVMVRGIDYLLMPMLFFVGYGAIGNAIAHTTWAVWLGEYFPGFGTAVVHAILGPLLLAKLLGSTRAAAAYCAGFALVLPPILIAGMSS